ncbi:MAG: hypothetical protein HC927_04850 [Deltaproteobacteria bacterium]|nr:hypothetical protein [Deltaproteobacteria bacterium]
MSSASLSGSSMQAPRQRPASKANVVGIVIGAIIFVAALTLAAWVGLQLV